mgnify:CR=1 FL=1
MPFAKSYARSFIALSSKPSHRTHVAGRAGIALVALLAAGATSLATAADAFPSKPIQLVVPFSSGNAINDTVARLLAPHLGEHSIFASNTSGLSITALSQTSAVRGNGSGGSNDVSLTITGTLLTGSTAVTLTPATGTAITCSSVFLACGMSPTAT